VRWGGGGGGSSLFPTASRVDDLCRIINIICLGVGLGVPPPLPQRSRWETIGLATCVAVCISLCVAATLIV